MSKFHEDDDSMRNNSTAKQSETTFSYDEVLEHIGQLGRYQLCTFLVLLLPCFFFGLTILSYTFVGGMPQYRCRVDGCDPTGMETGDFEPEWLKHAIPWSDQTPKLLRQCKRFNETWSNTGECLTQNTSYDQVQLMNCDSGWVYDLSNFHTSIVTEFDLTCDDEWKHTTANTVFLVGMLLGAVTMGNLADIIGRRKAFSLTFGLLAICSTACAFINDYWTFTVLRFFCGIFNIGFFLAAFTWGMEAVGSKYRDICGYVFVGITSVGSICLGLTAYYVRDWRTLQLILSIPMFPLLLIPCFISESTRWLLSQKRYDEAYELILKAAKINRKAIPTHILEKFPQQLPASSAVVNHEDTSESKESFIYLFHSTVLFKRLLILFVAWVGTNMGYYGLTFSASNLSGDFYLNFVLSVFVEIPAKIVSVLVIKKLGRRTIFCGGLISSGLFCLATGLVPEDPTYFRMILSITGKFFVTCSLGLIYLYTSEMFPTSTRSAALGMCATMSKFGSIAAPALAEVGRNLNPTTPYIIFAIVNISVGLLCLMLPETANLPLPSTIKEAEDIEKYALSCSCCKRKDPINIC